MIEEETGVFVDDDALQPDTTVGDLIALVEAARGAKRGVGAWKWPLSPIARASGLALQILLMYPFVRLFYRIRTHGLERLKAEDARCQRTPSLRHRDDTGIARPGPPLACRCKVSVAADADPSDDQRLRNESCGFAFDYCATPAATGAE